VGLINVESLTKALEGENPCGENLRWDRAYLELERLAEGTEETQMGNSVKPAEEPDWREVRDKTVELLGRGRHLRLGIILTIAAIRLEGFPGLRDGLKVIESWLTQTWDQIWPVLDVEDNNDPTERINAIASLSTPMATYGDKMRLVDRVYESPVCESRQLGRFSLRDIAIASGAMDDKRPKAEGQDDRPPPTLSIIDGAFAETDKERLAEFAAAATEAAASLEAISNVFTEKCGAGIGPNVTPLATVLKDAITQITRRLAGEGSEEGSESVGAEEGGGEAEAGEGGGGGGPRIAGNVVNPQDALKAIERVITYYETREPSSPVPLILKCASRMVGLKFLEISKVLTPDVVQMFVNVSTPPEEASS
jgi:type VI secretion system protein ImpA